MTREEIDHIVDAKSFPHPTQGTKLTETHISWVVLADDYVYKIKKPVKFEFLDFSTLEKRKLYCERETELNRRLAPSMYLGVLPVLKNGNKFCIGEGPGETVDYAVLMERMDRTKRLDVLFDKK